MKSLKRLFISFNSVTVCGFDAVGNRSDMIQISFVGIGGLAAFREEPADLGQPLLGFLIQRVLRLHDLYAAGTEAAVVPRGQQGEHAQHRHAENHEDQNQGGGSRPEG